MAGHAVDPALLLSNIGFSGLTFFAPGPQGVVLELELGPGAAKRLQLTATDRSLALPAAKVQPLSAEIIAAPGYSSFTTQITNSGDNLRPE